jgi:hypothetical protein
VIRLIIGNKLLTTMLHTSASFDGFFATTIPNRSGIQDYKNGIAIIVSTLPFQLQKKNAVVKARWFQPKWPSSIF